MSTSVLRTTEDVTVKLTATTTLEVSAVSAERDTTEMDSTVQVNKTRSTFCAKSKKYLLLRIPRELNFAHFDGSTLGDWAFPVAAARAWNSLPTSVRSLSSYLTLRRNLKSLLFSASFQDD